MPLNEYPIHFDVGGQRCHGMLHLPKQVKAPVPAVLMLHGFTGQRMEPHRLFVLFSRLLAQKGIASLRFDFRGSGESEGTFDQMTVSRQLQDVSAAYAFLSKRLEVDMSRLGLLGLSMGGMMAALSVAHHPFAALCLWAPAHPKLWLREHHGKPLTDQQLQKSFKAAIKEARLPQVRLHPGGLDWNGNPMSFKFFHDLNRHQPLKTITAHTGPALVVHGTADPAVPLEVGQLYAGAIKARFHPIQDGLHTFEVLPHQEEVYRVTLGFFEKELKGKAEKPKAKG